MSKKKDSFWAMGFNLYGCWSDKPIKVYENTNNWSDKVEYYDRGGNLSCKSRGFKKESESFYTFGSDDKAEVERFIYYANSLMNRFKMEAEEELKNSKRLDLDLSIRSAYKVVFELISNATR